MPFFRTALTVAIKSYHYRIKAKKASPLLIFRAPKVANPAMRPSVRVFRPRPLLGLTEIFIKMSGCIDRKLIFWRHFFEKYLAGLKMMNFFGGWQPFRCTNMVVDFSSLTHLGHCFFSRGITTGYWTLLKII